MNSRFRYGRAGLLVLLALLSSTGTLGGQEGRGSARGEPQEIASTVELLKARRSSAGVSVQAYDQRELNGTAAIDAADFVLRRSPRLLLRAARGNQRRWRVTPIGSFGFEWSPGPAVVIDERPVTLGMVKLRDFRPDDFYLIEIYSGGKLIRAYTEQFLERLARGETGPLMPIRPDDLE